MSKNVEGSTLLCINRDVSHKFDNSRASNCEIIKSKADGTACVNITDEYADATKTNVHMQKTNELCIITKRCDEDIKNHNIYRYKIADEIIEKIYQFSKIHQYDHRKDFKEAWNIWLEENEELVNYEKRRLLNLGYEGDVLDKMFKSARYYFRKKSTEKKEPKERRNYIGVDKSLLSAMDDHLKKTQDKKPELSFDEFCKENMECLKNEVIRLLEFGFEDAKEIQNKIKKTYKNRYFMLIKK